MNGHDHEDLQNEAALDLHEEIEACVAGEEHALDREALEVLAQLPYALEPVVPRPGLRDEVLSRVRGGGAAADRVVDFAPRRASEPAAASTSSAWWLRGLAAALAVCLLGLAFLAGKVSQLSSALTAVEAELASASDPAFLAAGLHDRFDLVESIARTAYPLHPAADAPELGHRVAGMVYVCPEHGHWRVNLEGLEPPPQGFEYHLWFVTGGGLESGGALEVEEGGCHLAAADLPAGTHDFAITLEPAGAAPQTGPAGRRLLETAAPVYL